MRFKIPFIQPYQQLLDLAFKHGRQAEPVVAKRIRKKERWAKEIERTKLEAIADELDEKLRKIEQSFPDFDAMPFFYQQLADATIDLNATRMRLGNIKRTAKIVQKLRREHLGKIFRSKTDRQIKDLSRSFYGRVSSSIKKIGPDLLALENSRKELERLPNLRTDCMTVLLAGYPNVGKSTVLSRLTGSTPEIAAYPFTTKGLKLGYFKEKFFDFQVIDTPGLLDRQKRNPIEQKAVSALRELDGLVVLVIDPSVSSGFSIEQQFELYNNLKKEFSKRDFLVTLNKVDVATEEQLEHARKLFEGAIESKPNDATLRNEIVTRVLKNSKPVPRLRTKK